MSAFICSDYHVSVIAAYGTRHNGHRGLRVDDRHWTDAEEVFHVLMAENVRSVMHRYPDVTGRQDAPGTIDDQGTFIRRDLDRNPIEIIQACHCLAYQSCETEDWESTLAFKLLKAIEADAVRSLPGYDKADAWELKPPQRKARA